MSRKDVFYCWVRVISRANAEKEAKDGDLHILIPNKPPKKVTSKDQPAGVVETWVAHEDWYNQPANAQWLFDYNHAFWSEKAALKWKTDEGGKWFDNAESYSLMTFELGDD